MSSNRHCSFLACFLVFLFAEYLIGPSPLAAQAEAAAPDEPAVAAHLIELTGIERGVCSVLGGDNDKLAMELARSGSFIVNLLDPQGPVVETVRKRADKEGLYGKTMTADEQSLEKLPYADNMIDLVVSTHIKGSELDRLCLPEILRVLRPRGKAVIGRLRAPGKRGLSAEQLSVWLRSAGNVEHSMAKDSYGLWAVVTKPPLEGAADWTHWEHGPDNNPVSRDTAIRAPFMTHFLGLPYFISMPAITTVAEGRVFTAAGHIAHHKREETWLNTLVAQNGYNGTELWTKKLPDGYLAHRSAFIATGKTFYMISPEGNGCLLLDPKTGEEKDRVRIPELKGEWKWIALADGILYALLGEAKDPPQTHLVRSNSMAWSWDDLSPGYYEERVPWGFGTTILAYELDRKKVLWVHAEEAPLDSRAMVIGDGKIFFYGPDSHVGCVNAKTGRLLWTNGDPLIRELVEEPGKGLTSTPGFRTTCFCLYTPRAIFYEAQTRMNIVAVSSKDGSLLWHRKKTTNNPNMLCVDGNLVVGIGPEGSTQVIDPLTGETIEDLGFSKHNCARLTATRNSYFCRGWEDGLTRYDRKKKKVFYNGAVRPACNDGAIPANGLLYLGLWPCDCNLTLVGRVVLCPAGDFDFECKANNADRLEAMVPEPERVTPLDISDKDWPTYRANNFRSAGSRVAVPGKAEKIWEFIPRNANKPTVPTAAGGLIFLCGDDCKVRALDASSGKPVWTFLTGGPVMHPPTIWQGRAYVGSGDGYIYALEATSGKLLWRFRAAPAERRIMVYGSICSTWPVNNGILVEDGVAYAAAGIVDYDGIYVYALDAVTGKLKWQNISSGHLDRELRKGVSAQGVLSIGQGRLWMPGGNVVSPASYDLATGKYLGGSAGDGSPRSNRGQEVGIIGGRYLMLGGRLRYSPSDDNVKPGKFTVFGIQASGELDEGIDLTWRTIPPAWDDKGFFIVHGRYKVIWDDRKSPADRPYLTLASFPLELVEKYLEKGNADSKWPECEWVATELGGSETVSLAAALNAVLAVCETPVESSRNSRWSVRSIDRASGKVIWEHELSSPALPSGLLIDRDGRVIVIQQNGSVACFGSQGAI